MHTFAEKPKATQQTTSAKSTISGRTHLGQGRDVNTILHLQRTIGNQAVQRLLQSNAGELQMASSSLASPRFAHDFSRIPVHASQVRAHAAPREPAALRARDMEEPIKEDRSVLTDQDIGADATPPNAVPQQVAPPGPPLALGPIVPLPRHMRGSSSPAGMPDRIPPRVDTPAAVTITGLTVPMQDITLSIEGAGSGNGTATINGAATVDLGVSATVQLRGVDQTAGVGNAGNLRLVASHGGTRLAASAGFSVSSIPQNWSVTLNALVTGPKRGIVVNNNWESDSTDVTDLDKAMRSEQVQYGVGTGCFAGVTRQNSGYIAANSPPLVDSHAAPVELLTGVGSIVAEQTFIFRDDRTGAVDIPARNSGFRLTRNVTVPAPGTLAITTTKTGTATTANGFSSAPGSGTATSGAQAV